MTTEQTNLQQSDADEALAEHQPVSETTPHPAGPEVTTPPEAALDEHDQAQAPQDEQHTVADTTEETAASTLVALSGEQETSDEHSLFSFAEVIPLVEEDAARPFTDFIEEFRQAEEARVSSSLRESAPEPFPVEKADMREFIIPFAPQLSTAGEGEGNEEEVQKEQIPASQEEKHAVIDIPTNTAVESPVEQKAASTESPRPVSPLLRPASRLRLPRHGAGRQREEQATSETTQTVPAPEAAPTEVPPRPARRYRFDRPVASTVSAHIEEGKDTTNRGLTAASVPAQVDDGSIASKEVKPGSGQPKQAIPQAPEQSSPQQPELPTTNGGETTTETPALPSYEHRPQGQDRQREKEQTTPTPAPAAISAAETTPPVTEPAAPQTAEVDLEDLPPLEYAELQRASSRRRRRRRSGDTPPATPTANTALTTKAVPPEPPTIPTQVPMQPPAVATPRAVAPAPEVAPAAAQYNIVSGYTVSQMNQGNSGAGPFMSPEPSPARGSSPVRGSLRAVRPDAQRPSVYPVRTGDPVVNQFANAVVQAIQAQTDRVVNELRRTTQTPSNISVSLPPFPSTERVGVFVDVANLLYSARTLRITIDFAKLLDFLRGNRRLVRAQAYCPTSPHSSEDQMFLQAVKGLGYRITTKNYKTFSSGAKKADLDLDLCMDVVRLVDGRAVDCIVLVSGDSDFMPMLDYCSDHGVRVEVAAFDEAMSATLRQSCDLFINLAMLEEIRA